MTTDQIPDPRYDLQYHSIPNALLLTAERTPDAEAFVDAHHRLTYAQLRAEVIDTVRAMIGFGIRPGDRVAVWAPNAAEWAIAALGVLGAGGIVVPVSVRFTGREVEHVLRDSGARLLLAATDSGGSDLLARLGPDDLPSTLEQTVVIKGPDAPGALSWTAFRKLGDGIRPEDALTAMRAVGPDDISDIMFTSGTTGAPKGVIATHGQSLRCHGYMTHLFGLGPGDHFMIVPPFFHSFGYKFGWVACVMHGATAYTLERYDAEDVMKLVHDEKISILPGPPTLFTDIIDHPRRGEYDLSSLRATNPSAATVPPALARQLHDVLGVETVLTGFGLTEATAVVSTCQPGDDFDDVVNSVGRPLPDVEVRIVDDDRREVPDGSAGELEVRGYNVMQGYWNNPKATAEVLSDGWLRTGDIAIRNERGFLRITDRKKDMYISGGLNVYPAEVEHVLFEHPDVAAGAVIGVPDDRLGETGMAFVVPRSAEAFDVGGLLVWLRERLAGYKMPHYVQLVDDLPRNASLKVLKGELRQQAAAILSDPTHAAAAATKSDA
ncbi:MAG TPA: AMP-binding protein [Mycobacteriales bacterium]|nr:AMP-binding protein [Mycobacteriales bacterium]